MAQAPGQPGWGLSPSTFPSIIPWAWGWELSASWAHHGAVLCVCRRHRDHAGGVHPKVLQGAELWHCFTNEEVRREGR